MKLFLVFQKPIHWFRIDQLSSGKGDILSKSYFIRLTEDSFSVPTSKKSFHTESRQQPSIIDQPALQPLLKLPFTSFRKIKYLKYQIKEFEVIVNEAMMVLLKTSTTERTRGSSLFPFCCFPARQEFNQTKEEFTDECFHRDCVTPWSCCEMKNAETLRR